MKTMERYSVDIAWSDEDEGFIATVDEFPYLSAFGETREDALKEAQIALEGFLESYEDDGEEPPQPRKREAYSGQIRIRMPRSLHRRLARDAEREGVSLNHFMVCALSEKVGYRRGVTRGLQTVYTDFLYMLNIEDAASRMRGWCRERAGSADLTVSATPSTARRNQSPSWGKTTDGINAGAFQTAVRTGD